MEFDYYNSFSTKCTQFGGCFQGHSQAGAHCSVAFLHNSLGAKPRHRVHALATRAITSQIRQLLMSIVSLLIQTRFSFHSTVTVYAAIDAQSDIRTLFSWLYMQLTRPFPFFFFFCKCMSLACETTEMKPPAFKTLSHQFLSTWGVVSLRKKEKKLHLKWKEKKFRELVDYLCRDGVDMQYMLT